SWSSSSASLHPAASHPPRLLLRRRAGPAAARRSGEVGATVPACPTTHPRPTATLASRHLVRSSSSSPKPSCIQGVWPADHSIVAWFRRVRCTCTFPCAKSE
uniref:Uncharacterized protein n=1 Tax=Aegilops tauschii subsp. strangulata TaxID=200361 RepID=A0A452XYL7_AEGTS